MVALHVLTNGLVTTIDGSDGVHGNVGCDCDKSDDDEGGDGTRAKGDVQGYRTTKVTKTTLTTMCSIRSNVVLITTVFVQQVGGSDARPGTPYPERRSFPLVEALGFGRTRQDPPLSHGSMRCVFRPHGSSVGVLWIHNRQRLLASVECGCGRNSDHKHGNGGKGNLMKLSHVRTGPSSTSVVAPSVLSPTFE